jgi:hypothetical protein
LALLDRRRLRGRQLRPLHLYVRALPLVFARVKRLDEAGPRPIRRLQALLGGLVVVGGQPLVRRKSVLDFGDDRRLERDGLARKQSLEQLYVLFDAECIG